LVFNGTNIQVAKGYTTVNLSFRLVTDNVTSAPTSLSATAVGTNTINLSWTTPSETHGDPIQSYQVWRDGIVYVNSTGSTSTSYSDTSAGPSQGTFRYYNVCGWNRIGCSPLSNFGNATTYQMTTATVPSNKTVVGDAFGVTPKLRMITGIPAATITDSKLYRNGTLVDSNTHSTSISAGQTVQLSNLYSNLLNDAYVYNHTLVIQITNGTGSTQTFANSTFDTPWYTANYYTINGHQVNYTWFRTTDFGGLNLTVNRNPVTFQLECNFKHTLFDDGEWVNVTNVGYFTLLQDVPTTQTVYVRCYNDAPIIDFASYGQFNGTLAILDFSEELGDFFGVPVIFLFVIFLAGLFTGVRAPIGAIFLVGTIGFMGVMGFFPDDDGDPLLTGAVWGLLVLLGGLGLFIGKRYS
jgi:hypothetical protein